MPEGAVQLMVALFLAHVLLDFPLYPSKWQKERRERGGRAPTVYLHVFLHAVATWTCFLFFSGALGSASLAGLVVLITHYLVELLAGRRSGRPLMAFVGAQLTHGVVLFALWTAFVGLDLAGRLTAPLLSAPALVVTLAYALILWPTSTMIRLLLDPWLGKIPGGEDGNTRESLGKAGAVIGYLERFMVLTFVLLNQFAAIGFVLAIKTAFRFRELDDRKMAEYFMLGTFYSFSLTLALGIAVSRILRHL